MNRNKISCVVICKNACSTIGEVIASALQLADDVVVVDSGSTDGSVDIIKKSGARLLQTEWDGFGPTKNKGNAAARYDWILSLDADEVLSEELIRSINRLDLSDVYKAYSFRRLNYLKGKPVRFGQWGRDWALRLFNRNIVSWDYAPVHEKLVFPIEVTVVKINGILHHYTAPDLALYKKKLERYAVLMANKYRANGKKVTWFSRYLSAGFNFFKHYILEGGFLDGVAGWEVAKAHAEYTYRKYELLSEADVKSTNT